jgi:hypothetical protein
MSVTSVTVQDLMMAAPRLEVQLALAGMQAVLWYVMLFCFLPPYISRAINSMKSRERFLDNSARSYKKMFMLDFNGDRERLFEFTVLFQGILFQHLVGGLLCLPSVLGCSWVSPSMASALACHGALCEVGWEIQDFLVRLKELVFDGEAGRKKNPAPFMAVLVLHHTVAQCLVLPLNLHYRDNIYYHEAVLLLQAATVVAMICQTYGFTLDISRPSERGQMMVVVTVSFLAALWARVLRYAHIWYVLLTTFVADGNFFVLKMALVPLVTFSLFNVLVVADFYNKFAKFVLGRGRKSSGGCGEVQQQQPPQQPQQQQPQQPQQQQPRVAPLTISLEQNGSSPRRRRCRGAGVARSPLHGRSA